MRHRTKFLCRMALFSGVALAAGGFVPAHAQQQGRPDMDAQQTPDRDQDATRRELADLDRFLDQHPQVNQLLQENPGLVNDQNFLSAHPQFSMFLQAHPALQQRFSADPSEFLRLENRFERREERGERANPQGTQRELAELDQFLDQHPRVNEDLQRNPALVNDQNFLNAHPDFAQFLQAHPNLQQRFSANPHEFLRRENGFETREERGERAKAQATPRELADLDRFLDQHSRVNEDLQRNPALVNDRNFLNANPDFAQFLQTHPNLQQRFSADPHEFLRQENGFETRENRTERQQPAQAMPRELAELDRFMDSHPQVSQALQANPGLVNDRNFLNAHPDFAQFLQTHPTLQQRFSANPNSFMRREDRFEAREDRTDVDRNRDDRDRVDQDRDRDDRNRADADRDRDARDRDASARDRDDRNRADADRDRDVRDRDADARDRDDRDRDRNFDRDRNRPDDRDRDRERAGENVNPPANQREFAQLDQFLDDHPKIEKDLEKKPSLVNNKKFLDHNKELGAFLDVHPTLKQQFATNPTLVIQRENRFERGEDQRNLAQMDQFLDKHKKIAKELAQNPSLGTNQKFLDHNKDFANFLNTHQELKTDFDANPTRFMQQESRFENHEGNNHRLNNRSAKKTDNKEDKNLEHRENMSSDRTH